MKLTGEEKEIVCDNLKLVDYILQKRMYIYPNNPYYEDYQQEGRYGLILAVQRFDKDKGYEFATYASHYIQGFAARYRREFVNSQMKIPRKLIDVVPRVLKLSHEGLSTLEIREELDISAEDSQILLNVCKGLKSLDEPVAISNDDTADLKDVIGNIDPGIEDLFGEEIALSYIDRVTEIFSKQSHKDVWIEYAYGSYYGEDIPQKVLATKYNVNQPMISRIISKGKKELMRIITEEDTIQISSGRKKK